MALFYGLFEVVQIAQRDLILAVALKNQGKLCLGLIVHSEHCISEGKVIAYENVFRGESRGPPELIQGFLEAPGKAEDQSDLVVRLWIVWSGIEELEKLVEGLVVLTLNLEAHGPLKAVDTRAGMLSHVECVLYFAQHSSRAFHSRSTSQYWAEAAGPAAPSMILVDGG